MADGSLITRRGIVHGMPFADYLAGPEVSKSSLWTLHSRSPAHARVEKEASNAMQLGTAIHCAILEPDFFTERFHRGPDDRRGNKWKEAQEECGDRLLTSGDYDDALAVRDAVSSHPVIRRLTGAGTVREVSAFGTDPITGLAIRTRPDAFAPGIGLMADLKTTTDARASEFARRVGQLGYHAGEAIYTDTWRAAGGELDAFVFIVVEPKPPYAAQVFELSPDAVEEGRVIIRKALDAWARCVEAGAWPAYPTDVQPLDLRKWDYRETQPLNEAA
jgi:exodeoxyribonuclease VIII